MGSSTASTCPAMDHYVAADLCQENFAGIAGKVYIGFKEIGRASCRERVCQYV